MTHSPAKNLAASTTPALLVENVSHSFGTNTALDQVSLAVEPGRICGLLGLNGAGKTTLFSLITRLYDNTSGTIRVFGHDVRKNPGEALRRIGVVFQPRTLDPELTVQQNLHYHAALYGLPKAVSEKRIAEELGRASLAGKRHSKVRTLSGGEARRIEIVRALLHKPSLLLLDEPTVGLDIGAREAILNHVRSLATTDNLAVLWATHLFDEIGEDDQVVILHQGRTLTSGNHNDILDAANCDNLADAFRFHARTENRHETARQNQ